MSEATEAKNIVTIAKEEDFVKKLGNIAAAKADDKPDFDLLLEDEKTKLDSLTAEIEGFLVDNSDFGSYSEEDKNKKFDEVFSKLDELKVAVKHGVCHFDVTGIEIKTIDKKLHQSVEYTAETLFYGLHLKENFLSSLPKPKAEFENYNLTISFSHSVALYHVLSSMTVKGLNKENFALAHVLYTCAELSKVYTHYNNLTVALNRKIMQWNMELSGAEDAELKNAVVGKMIADEKAKAEKNA